MYRLRCSDADGITFDVMPSMQTSTGFRERCHYVLDLQHAGPCVLVIDDVVMDCVRDIDRHRWTWQPGFFAGTVLAELFDDHGKRLAEFRLDVSPAPHKLGQDLFAQILDDLLEADPALLFGAEAAHAHIGAAGQYSNPYLEYGRIKKFGPLLVRAIETVRHHRLTQLRSDRQLVPPHQVRRLDQHSARSLVRAPRTLAALHGVTGAAAPPERLRLDVPVTREELDTSAHRTLLALLLRVVRRLRKVRADLERLGADTSANAFRTPSAPRLDYRRALLDDLERTLRRQCRETPFATVRHAQVSSAGLTAIAGHPPYALAYRRGWQILRPGIDGEREGDTLAISPTWEIYERWCYLRVVQTLRQMFPSLRWERSVDRAPDRLRDTGSAAGTTVTAYLQKTFPAMDQIKPGAPFFSISSERRPDIVVTCTIDGRKRFAVFDPKYSVARSSVLSAMETAHIYRDCLRWHGCAPELALLLIPAASTAAWLEQADFHVDHGVGVLPLSPGSGQEPLRAILQRVLF
ncbi:DUF2357 domain-containing protein [Massilia atriviolacea]|uniref:DUF2357 domain-containing protein n=1 Tax=Massilia atriviolacea TaxID=2495579 RepID=A0A430HLU6_9BURK|nr:DUF2357 domain-containing protein [Massilia atriviolacea]RSZ58528.1 DUF2357 domain-containing protein [Massilia atriviolacea]